MSCVVEMFDAYSNKSGSNVPRSDTQIGGSPPLGLGSQVDVSRAMTV